MIKEATEIIAQGNDLTASQMEIVMEEIMTGKCETSQIVSFLTALNHKGECIDELVAAVLVMRRHVTRINTNRKPLLDTCGTGGDRKGTFNISTVVAFVASGAGIAVAKHGNRCVSSKSGSADVLEALGININMTPTDMERCLNEIGIAFLFAPNLHPAMKYAMPARKQMGVRTIFNLIGPLTNPAGATHQLLGVFDSHLTKAFGEVLGSLGTTHALIAHGKDGLDEITTTDSTFISEVYNGKLNNYEVQPEDFGFKRASLSDLAGGSASDNARILLDILNGQTGPKRDIVVLNAAAAIYAASKAKTIKDAIGLAEESIDSHNALKKMLELKKYSA